jgi:hypothetical protein
VFWGAALSDAAGSSALAAAGPVVRSRHPLALLRDPATIRARCTAILRSVEDNRSASFKLDRAALDAAADRVAALTLKRFPDLRIPYHSRWRHFEAGGVDRKAELDALLAGRSELDKARVYFDLTIVSVLLDAGAGALWSYTESGQVDAMALPGARHGSADLLAMLDRAAAGPAAASASAAAPTGTRYTRSEGLGVASFRAFVNGAFSAHPDDPLRCDASALKQVDAAALRSVFQVTPNNPMVGLEGRAGLISRLGEALEYEAVKDGLPAASARAALVFDRLTRHGTVNNVSATAVLGELLSTMASIWKSGSLVQGLPGGDVWQHRWAGSVIGSAGLTDSTTLGWVPFHKLSQWMTYSLLEPLQWAGVGVTGLEALTGLPEYRNGGLLLDSGVIVARSGRDLTRTWKPGDEFIVEWRALTVVLLDELAQRVRARLGKTAQELPLACILEGGTWAAGREIAKELRSDGAPPVKIESDGTVF